MATSISAFAVLLTLVPTQPASAFNETVEQSLVRALHGMQAQVESIRREEQRLANEIDFLQSLQKQLQQADFSKSLETLGKKVRELHSTIEIDGTDIQAADSQDLHRIANLIRWRFSDVEAHAIEVLKIVKMRELSTHDDLTYQHHLEVQNSPRSMVQSGNTSYSRTYSSTVSERNWNSQLVASLEDWLDGRQHSRLMSAVRLPAAEENDREIIQALRDAQAEDPTTFVESFEGRLIALRNDVLATLEDRERDLTNQLDEHKSQLTSLHATVKVISDSLDKAISQRKVNPWVQGVVGIALLVVVIAVLSLGAFLSRHGTGSRQGTANQGTVQQGNEAQGAPSVRQAYLNGRAFSTIWITTLVVAAVVILQLTGEMPWEYVAPLLGAIVGFLLGKKFPDSR